MDQLAGKTVIEVCGVCGKLAFADDVVTISAAEYLNLKTAAALAHARKSLSTYRSVSNSAIARRPELADFIVDCAATMSIKQVHEACLKRFGTEAPSRSSVFRFVKEMKRVAVVPGRPR